MRYDPPLLTCFRPKAFHTTASTHSNSTSQRGDLGARATLLSPLFFLARDYTIIMGIHRDGGHGTSYSEKYFDGDRPAAMYNKNVEWLRYAHFWWLYLGFVAFFVTLLRLTILSKTEDWGMVLMVTHVVHNVVFFYLFHWIKGSPDNFSQGEFNGLTLWEQIDDGIPWTKTKKFFFLIHTALVFAASYVTDYDLNYLAMNGPVYVFLGIIPKIPEMHRVRVFGWNKTAGIDDVHEDALAHSATAAGGAATLGSKKSR